MGGGIPVSVEYDLILKLQKLDGSAEVAALEPGFEYEGGVILGAREVVGEQVYLKVLGIEITGGRRLLLIINDLVQECIHKDYYLDVLFNGFLQNVSLGLVDWIRLLVLGLQKFRACRQQLII